MLDNAPANYCNRCGAELLPAQSFCFRCGATEPTPARAALTLRMRWSAVGWILVLLGAAGLFGVALAMLENT